jgi:hypothetical protein
MRSPIFAVAAAGAFVVAIAPRPAEACDRLPLVGVTFRSFPADGARDVDPRTMVLVPQNQVASVPRLLAGPDFGDEGAVVDVDVVEVSVAGEYGGAELVYRLNPRSPLTAGTLYRVVAADVLDPAADVDGRIAEFVVAGDDAVVVDASALDAPVTGTVSVTAAAEDNTGFACAFDGTATIPVANDDNVMVVATIGDDDAFVGLGSSSVFVFGDDAFDIDVAFMDGQGRRSAKRTVSVDLQPQQLGSCAQGGGDIVWVPMLATIIGTVVASRRRRRHASSSTPTVARWTT